MDNNLTLLEARSVLGVSGGDADAFLQDLITCDLADCAVNEARYGALLTPQGKILFDFFLVRLESGYVLDCAQSQAAALSQRLVMYKLRRDVVIEAKQDMAVAAAWPRAHPNLTAGLICYQDPRLPALGDRVIAPAHVLAGLATTGFSAYEVHRISHGIGDSGADIGSGETFPHEVNFDQFNAVSFKKGCFVGQEVVSRMQHRGTARTRLVKVTADTHLPETGTAIEIDGKTIGSLASVQDHVGLALIRLDRLATATAQGLTPIAAGVALSVSKPEWATFDMPD